MKTAKITEIMWANEWNWPHGKLYYINMKLDNWETISLGKKKADAFIVGDQVSYEDYVDDKGKTRYKEVQDEQPKKTYDTVSTNKSATIWMALKIAFEVLYDPKKENFTECIALAHRIYDEAIAMYNEGEEKESAKDDKLPF